MRDYLLSIHETPLAFPSIRQIQIEVCVRHGIELREMLSARRARRVAIPRQEAMYRCYHETMASLPQIGRAFDRDHTTVMHAIRKHRERTGVVD